MMCANLAQATVTFDWSLIGNAGNVADTTGYGAVGYEYRIAKHEVTNAQYSGFLNAVAASDPYELFSVDMALDFGGITRSGLPGEFTYAAKAGRQNDPVNLVTWYDAARFVNWLHNGQGNGDTETGVYTLLGGTTTPSNPESIARSSNAIYFLPSEDEWYKAAYHDAAAGTAGEYFLFANGSDIIPVSDRPEDYPAGVNYFNNDGLVNGFNDGYAVSGSTTRGDDFLTDVGAYLEAESPYGTFDQNGNVWEWNEDLSEERFKEDHRAQRGGGVGSQENDLRSTGRNNFDPSASGTSFGFRVASVVPEPSTLSVLAISGLLVARRRR